VTVLSVTLKAAGIVPSANNRFPIAVVPLFITGRLPPIARLCGCSPQANQLGGGLNQLRRIETHAIFEDQLNLFDVFNLLRRVAAQHYQIGSLARRNRSDARVSAHVDCP
jgi:hypothetical protein